MNTRELAPVEFHPDTIAHRARVEPFDPSAAGRIPESHAGESDGAKWSFWDGVAPLTIQLPNNAPISSLVTYAATPQAIAVFGGAGTISGPNLFSTAGAAGTFRVPGHQRAITLVASEAFNAPLPIFVSSEKLTPTVALAKVRVTNTPGYPQDATPLGIFGCGIVTSSAHLSSSLGKVQILTVNFGPLLLLTLTKVLITGTQTGSSAGVNALLRWALQWEGPPAVFNTIAQGYGDEDMDFAEPILLPAAGLNPGALFLASPDFASISGTWALEVVMGGFIQ